MREHVYPLAFLRITLFFFALAGILSPAANAQSNCSASAPAANTVFIRGEGTTEQVADLVISCTNGAGGVANLQVFLSPSLPVTSKLINSSTGATEATAITSAGSVSATLSGSALSFIALPLP